VNRRPHFCAMLYRLLDYLASQFIRRKMCRERRKLAKPIEVVAIRRPVLIEGPQNTHSDCHCLQAFLHF
jgi:hypothetical protein